MNKIFSIELWQYDYPCDNARRMEWFPYDNELMLVCATQEQIDAWLNERFAEIVAHKISEYEEKIADIEADMERDMERLDAINSMNDAMLATLGIMKPNPSLIPNQQEEINVLRLRIEALETSSLQDIIDRGLIDRRWVAEKIEVKTLAGIDTEKFK
ncbi:hypothetical protein PHIM7_336 [Sinorhizobium phage phiM7]|uniref:Uncharacterized protein n=2 Tax=Emdodecavirus TaxID=1980937 RepID=S5MBR9_9CAUD|nr:hypothetical protein AB690_gp179 [Sinorhizobium phage phiM12]YP_009601461.1 hypothetical protein FDH46_gp142 [Sinorhizobium phage phiM7]AGR48063.1 hypothetical protein SmphiM12_431 [Sinorhizobium phage phiM12]AKF12881.1 hypothetical protein PHIM7_336 [Sinorhizobium phage phiM7]AKF13241.1 hypothetical protein PHIM19_336 [Sinorhizobium phage phiM19]